MKEETRVIHCRLKDKTIMGCRDLLLGSGHNVDGVPMSSIVRDALEGIIDFMVKKEQLPNDPDVTTALNMVYTPDEDNTDFGLEGLMQSMKGEISEDELVKHLTKEATKHIEESSNPDIAEEVVITETVENKKIVKCNLFSMSREKLEDLSKQAPKDRLIQLANENKDNKVFIVALEIVYSKLPLSMWGSEVAEMQIQNLQDMHSEK